MDESTSPAARATLAERLLRARTALAEGRAEAARPDLDAVLDAEPGHPEARLLHLHALKIQGERDLGSALGGLLAELEGGLPATAEVLVEALRLRAMLNLEAGRRAEAIPDLERALGLEPANGELLLACGSALCGEGRFAEGLEWLQRARPIQEDQPAYWEACGLALQGLGRTQESLGAFQRALALAPRTFRLLMRVAQILADLGRIPDTAPLLARADELEPGNPAVVSGLLGTALYDAARTPAELAALHRAWVETLEAKVAELPPGTRDWDPERPLCVAYLSPDFREHSCAPFVEALLESHDRARVRVVLIPTLAFRDGRTARFRDLADEWIEAWDLDDAALAERIQAEGVDVLVDLAGHTGGNRLTLLARRPAPVQVSWLGYPFTTGLTRLDGRITDARVDPPGSEGLGSEPLLRLDPCYLCWKPPASGPEPAEAPALQGRPFTFGSFNHFSKLNGGVIATWAAILRRVPGSRILLKGKGSGDEWLRERVWSAFEAEGVPRGRVSLAGWAERSASHLEHYRSVDLGLDPFPYNGVTTSLESLWMGVPFVALRGVHSLSRQGLMILTMVGLEGLIAPDPAAYVERAVDLAREPEQLRGLRQDLRSRLLGSPLCDAAGFARRMEGLYRERWRAACARNGRRMEPRT